VTRRDGEKGESGTLCSIQTDESAMTREVVFNGSPRGCFESLRQRASSRRRLTDIDEISRNIENRPAPAIRFLPSSSIPIRQSPYFHRVLDGFDKLPRGRARTMLLRQDGHFIIHASVACRVIDANRRSGFLQREKSPDRSFGFVIARNCLLIAEHSHSAELQLEEPKPRTLVENGTLIGHLDSLSRTRGI